MTRCNPSQVRNRIHRQLINLRRASFRATKFYFKPAASGTVKYANACEEAKHQAARTLRNRQLIRIAKYQAPAITPPIHTDLPAQPCSRRDRATRTPSERAVRRFQRAGCDATA